MSPDRHPGGLLVAAPVPSSPAAPPVSEATPEPMPEPVRGGSLNTWFPPYVVT